MGKNPNTFQKRQREFNKKQKAEDKRKRRLAQKNAALTRDTTSSPDTIKQSDPVDDANSYE
jgi:hypothetical protein